MAYIIRKENNFYKIAANDTDKNEHNLSYDIYSTIDISDSDFAKLKKNMATISISGDTATITDIETGFETQEILEGYVNDIKKNLNAFLENSSNNTKAIYSDAQTYSNSLDSFDFSSISYPLQGSWEKYCEDNSITYVSPLQLP